MLGIVSTSCYSRAAQGATTGQEDPDFKDVAPKSMQMEQIDKETIHLVLIFLIVRVDGFMIFNTGGFPLHAVPCLSPTGKEFWNLKSKDQTVHFSLPISTFDSFNFEIKTSAGGTIASVLPKLNVHFRIKRYSEQAIIPENKESLSFLAMKVSFTILCLMAKKRDWSCLILQKGLASLFGLLGFDEKEQRFTTMPHRIRSSPWSHTCPPSWTCSSSSQTWSPQWTLSSSSYTWTSAPSWPSFPWVLSFKSRGAFFAWRAPILSWPRIMCSQVRMLKFLEPSREMP